MSLVSISKMEQNSAAEIAGLQLGDSIVTYNNVPVKTINDILRGSRKLSSSHIRIIISRNGTERELYIQPSNWGVKLRGTKESISKDKKLNISTASKVNHYSPYNRPQHKRAGIKTYPKQNTKENDFIANSLLTILVFVISFSIILVINQISYGGCFKEYCIDAAIPKTSFFALIISAMFFFRDR